MNLRVFLFCLTASTIFGLASAPPAQAQIFDKIKKKAKEAAEDEAIRNVEEFVRNAVKCAFSDRECIERAEESGEDVVITDDEGNVLYDEDGQPYTDPDEVPTEKRPSSTYDFEPGERALVEMDFTAVNPGDFPRDLEYISGNMEVVEWQGRRFLRARSDDGIFAVPLPEVLPDRFTLEFELMDGNISGGTAIALVEPERFRGAWKHKYEKAYFNVGRSQGSGIYGGNEYRMRGPISVSNDRRMREEVLPVRIMVDDQHAKVYVGQRRVANVPQADFGRSDKIYFFLHPDPAGKEGEEIYLANLRVAAGGRDLYEALSADGRVAVQNILFDTGKSTIREESSPVLEEIGTMLQEHPDLNLLIEGHTDDEGGFDMNMKLSGERAASVKAYLVENYGIEETRLRTIGLGPTQPVDSNETEEGRQKNRRVELVKMQ